MANQFEPIINELKDKSDKDGSKKLLYQEYKNTQHHNLPHLGISLWKN
ncbi:Uncharacterised protein [Rodentibacter pneumotropicus]|uniref:Uncharacterized protein n=1 Tax=Rodentibacter pneumotropicus TaxID=758 RepID=A0A448MQ31_9PAST|nr:Uncharacterised protein [Rodentibacter pneumotropicus]